ncbi:MAG: hypothetical protein J6W80_01955 [Kiritimatiellae bacterium]|nr:hypothetical protein [Kiritimatiellia bacterium]
MNKLKLVSLPVLAILAGCAAYSWRPTVPAGLRTVAVPTMRNESDVTELGNLATREILREFQREGTMKIASVGDAAIEIQGIALSAQAGVSSYSRSTSWRNLEYTFDGEFEISVVDKRNGKVLIEAKRYKAHTTFLSSTDILTAKRDAAGRLAEDLARQVVDDVLSYPYDIESADDLPSDGAEEALQ